MKTQKIEAAHQGAMIVGECPLWHAVESAIYWVDISGFTVHRLHPASGKHTAWPMSAEPSALAIDADGGLVVALRTGIVHLNTVDGSVTDIAAAPYDTSTMRFNDGRVDPAGRFWIGTIYEPRTEPLAQMYCLDKGALRMAWSGGMTVSNGLAFSPDGRAMYHADTTSHRIDRYSFDAATGTAARPEPFQRFSMDKANNYGGRPDGAAVDSEGAYWCAMIEGGCLLRFAPDGTQLHKVELPVRCPTMLAFGGSDLRTLYITSLSHGRSAEEIAQYPLTGHLLTMRVDVAGREEPLYLAR